MTKPAWQIPFRWKDGRIDHQYVTLDENEIDDDDPADTRPRWKLPRVYSRATMANGHVRQANFRLNEHRNRPKGGAESVFYEYEEL